MVVVIAVVFAWPLLQPDQVAPEPMGATPGAAPASGPAAVDLSSMTPRQAADRLFDRVMTAAETGDSAQAMQFLPMAIQAYERAQPLDLDGAFHLSTLQRTGLNQQGALTTAQAALEQDPDHLLLLHAAGEAARELGETELATGFYRRILDVYDAEANLQKPAYLAHENMLPSVRQNAADQVGG
jgi:tetratricopeptide (TPR) repeat protein